MDVRLWLFRNRSYMPIPFLLVMLVFAQPTFESMVIGFVLALVGEVIRFWGVSFVGSETRTTGEAGASQLVTVGPYAYVRNPLYIGNILIYIGFGVMSNAWFPWLTVIAAVYFVFQYSMIISLEEEVLRRKFGERYEAYTQKVPRFFPRIRRDVLVVNSSHQFNLRRGFASERRTLQAFVLVSFVIFVLWLMRK
ncbi:MAG: methyltransferase family protein [Bacteroidota bacterium]